MKAYIFKLPMGVRDYECDIEGIVNNANYLHYMEHTRHQFLLSVGVSFIELHKRGIDCVVARINMAFKTPLRSDDAFINCLNIKKDGVKYVFYQDIYRASDERLVIRAQVETVCIVNGQLGTCEDLDKAFADYLTTAE